MAISTRFWYEYYLTNIHMSETWVNFRHCRTCGTTRSITFCSNIDMISCHCQTNFIPSFPSSVVSPQFVKSLGPRQRILKKVLIAAFSRFYSCDWFIFTGRAAQNCRGRWWFGLHFPQHGWIWGVFNIFTDISPAWKLMAIRMGLIEHC